MKKCNHKVCIDGATLKNNLVPDKFYYMLCLLCGKVKRRREGELEYGSWR